LAVLNDWQPGGNGVFFGSDLIAQTLHGFRGWADENNAFFPATTR
jgi:hypothetical protein